MGRFLVGAVAVVFALFVAGVIAVWLFKALLGAAFYLLIGAAVVGGGIYLYSRARRSLGDARTQRRIEAAAATWRQRNNR